MAGKEISGRLLLTAFAIDVTLVAPIAAVEVPVVVADGDVPFCKENIVRS